MNNYTYLAVIYSMALIAAICAFMSTRAISASWDNCPITKVINETEIWTKADENTFHRAKYGGCARHYPDAPCLKKFVKKGERRYYATCGRPD